MLVFTPWATANAQPIGCRRRDCYEVRQYRRDPDAGGVLSVVFWQPPVEDSGPWHRLTALTVAAGKPGSGNSDNLPVRLRPCASWVVGHRRVVASARGTAGWTLAMLTYEMLNCTLQAWAAEVPSLAVEAGATVLEDARPSYAMHWRDLQEFYRVRMILQHQGGVARNRSYA